jgi:hypothetical protein
LRCSRMAACIERLADLKTFFETGDVMTGLPVRA